MWLVIGLGNPGDRYRRTRHNAGFLVVDELARRWQLSLGRERSGAITARGPIAQNSAMLAKPQQYMNRSGGPTGALQRYHRIPVERLVVVHDEVDLPFGTVRVKQGGGHGGHKGLRDICGHVGRDFLRVRFGISRPPPRWDTADYVLGQWSEEQRQELEQLVDRAADAVELVLREGPASAMNRFNTRPRSCRGQKEAEAVRSGESRAAQQGSVEPETQ